MKRAHLGTCAGAVLALAVSSLGVTGTVQAAGSTSSSTRAPSSDHRADPGLRAGRAQGRDQHREQPGGARPPGPCASARSSSSSSRTCQRDVDGVEHVHYARTYAGLPVIGGDLSCTRPRPAGVADRRLGVDGSPIRVASTTPTVSADRGPRHPTTARSCSPRTTRRCSPGSRPSPAPPRTAPRSATSSTPTRAPASSSPCTPDQNDTGTGSSLYSGTVQPDHHCRRLGLDADRRHPRRSQDLRRHRHRQRDRLPAGHPVHRRRQRLGHRHHLEQAERRGRRPLRRRA